MYFSGQTWSVRLYMSDVILRSKIAQNVNADEAAVLGAALHGAGLSRQFKTKDIRIKHAHHEPPLTSKCCGVVHRNGKLRVA